MMDWLAQVRQVWGSSSRAMMLVSAASIRMFSKVVFRTTAVSQASMFKARSSLDHVDVPEHDPVHALARVLVPIVLPTELL